MASRNPYSGLPKQVVSIGVHGGLNTKTDPFQVQAPQTLKADNVMYVGEKEVIKRNGFTTLGAQPSGNTNLGLLPQGALVSYQGGSSQLSTLSAIPDTPRYTSVACPPPSSLTSTPAWAPQNSPSMPECESVYFDGTYAHMVWRERQRSGVYAGSWDPVANQWHVQPFQLYAPVTATSPSNLAAGTYHSMRIVSDGSYIYVFVAMDDGSVSGGMDYWSCPVNGPLSALTRKGSWAPSVNTGVPALGWDVQYFNGRFCTIVNNTGSTGAIFINTYTAFAGTLTFVQSYQAPSQQGGTKCAGYVSGNYLIVASTTSLAVVNTSWVVSSPVFRPGANSGTATPEGPVSVIVNAAGNQLFWAVPTGTVAVNAAAQLTLYTASLTAGVIGTLSTVSINPYGAYSLGGSTAHAPAFSLVSKLFFASDTAHPCAWVAVGGVECDEVVSTHMLLQTRASGAPWVLARANYLQADGTASMYQSLNANTFRGSRYTDTQNCWVAGPVDVFTSQGQICTFLNRREEVVLQPTTPGTTGAPSTRYTSWRGSMRFVTVNLDASQILPLATTPAGLFVGTAAPFMFDGQNVFEAGYSFYPDMTGCANYTTTAGTGTSGVQYLAFAFARRDAYGNTIRSSPGTWQLPSPSNFASVTLNVYPTYSDPAGTAFLEVYNTAAGVNSTAFVLQGATGGGSSGFGGNAVPLAYTSTDGAAGAFLYTSNGELPNDPAPACNAVACSKSRAFLIPSEDPTYIWPSKPFRAGRGVEWNADTAFQVDPAAGPNTAIGLLDNNLVVFKADSIYFFEGDGPDVTGTGTFGVPRKIPSGVGCIAPNSVVQTPDGLMFVSRRGVELLTRSNELIYVGAPIENTLDLTSTTIVSAIVIPQLHQVRFNNTYIYDYLFKRWSTYSNTDGCQSSIMLDGVHYFLQNGAIKYEKPSTNPFVAAQDDDGTFIPISLKTAWIPLGSSPQGRGRAYRVAILGSRTAGVPEHVNVTPSYDYGVLTAPTSTLVVNSAGSSFGSPFQFRFSRLPQTKAQSISLALTDSNVTFTTSCAISNIALEVGADAGIVKLSAAQTL